MKTLAVIAAALMSIALVTACGGDEGTPLSDKIAEIDTQLGVIETASATHESAVSGAANLGAMQLEETSYESNMTSAHTAMEHEVEEMGGCMNGDAAADTAAMGTAITNLGAELATHATTMAAAADMTAADDEETRHQTALAGLIGAVRTARDAMAGSAGDYMCGGGH